MEVYDGSINVFRTVLLDLIIPKKKKKKKKGRKKKYFIYLYTQHVIYKYIVSDITIEITRKQTYRCHFISYLLAAKDYFICTIPHTIFFVNQLWSTGWNEK